MGGEKASGGREMVGFIVVLTVIREQNRGERGGLCVYLERDIQIHFFFSFLFLAQIEK